jgi:hypothetical protein
MCLLTSATNVLVLDGMSTQAIKRHAARYGAPAQIFVDAGRQLAKLQDSSFNLQDLQLLKDGIFPLYCLMNPTLIYSHWDGNTLYFFNPPHQR